LHLIQEQLPNNPSSNPAQDRALLDWCQKLDEQLSTAHMTVTPLLIGFRDLAEQANNTSPIWISTSYSMTPPGLPHRYNASTERLDPSYYDLLASEARIASLIAIG